MGLTSRKREVAGILASVARVPLAQDAQAQGVQLDEAGRVLLVVGPRIVLESDVGFGIERVGRFDLLQFGPNVITSNGNQLTAWTASC